MKKLKAVKAVRGTEKQEIRHLGVMIEAVNNNVMILAEGQEVLGTRVNRVEEKLEVHTEMIAELAVDATILKQDMKEVKHALSEKADKKDIEAIKKELRKKADKEDILPLQDRVTVLEATR